MNKNKFGWVFGISDYLATAIAWVVFYSFRKIYIEPVKFGYDIPIEFTHRFYLGILIIPIFWVLLYYIAGSYKRVYRRSRLKDLVNTATVSFFGSLGIFFILILDDVVYDTSNYRSSFIVLFCLNFILRFVPRFIILTNIKSLIKQRKIGFNTVIVGNNQKAFDLFTELENEKYSQGYFFRGYVSDENEQQNSFLSHLPNIGSLNDLPQIIQNKNIEEVIIAIESSEHQKIEKIVDALASLNVIIKLIPDSYDIISGSVKMKNIFGTALIEIWPEIISPFQKNIKRILDIVISIFFLVLLSPIYLLVALSVKLGSNGPIFYKQERVGLRGKVFKIIKFRSMYTDAEKGSPQLSSDGDPRITSVGLILRKYRLDELPQFINVLKGEMSLVGPRPERQYFINKISERAPHYKNLLRVKPGITSWGMVKYGYAENIDQMVQRLKYDLLYLENMSIAMDFKILAYTVLTILKGSGK